MKTAARGRGGRPRLPPDQKRSKPLFVLMTPSEHQGLVDLAKRNSRSLSEEVVRRLRATLQRPDWEDSIELLADNSRTARRVLLEQGWRQWDDPRYGSMLLAPGSIVPPSSSGSGFISDEQAAQLPPRTGGLSWSSGQYVDPLVTGELAEVIRGLLARAKAPIVGRVIQAAVEALRGHVTPEGDVETVFPEWFETYMHQHKAEVAPELRDLVVGLRRDVERIRTGKGELSKQDTVALNLFEVTNDMLQGLVQQDRIEALFPQAAKRHEQDTGERRKRRASKKVKRGSGETRKKGVGPAARAR